MAAEDRKTGKFGTIYLDLYDASEGGAQRVRVLDVFNWELATEVVMEDVTIKGEVNTRHKVVKATNTWNAERYVQAPAVFSREVLKYLQNPTGANLAAMGTTAGVDGGANGTTGTLFGGEVVATAFGTGTAGNVRTPVHFALFIIDDNADSGTSDAVAAHAALPLSSFYEGQGYLVRGNITVPDGPLTDRIEVLVDGPLTYSEQPAA